MTVAQVRQAEPAGDVEVMFLESSRIYAVHASHSARDRVVALLREATTLHEIVRVTLPRVDSAEILDVQPYPEPEQRHSRRRL